MRVDHSIHLQRSGNFAPGDANTASERTRKVQVVDVAITSATNDVTFKSVVGTRHRAHAVSVASMHVQLSNDARLRNRRPRQQLRLILGGALQVLDHDYVGDNEFRSAIMTGNLVVDDREQVGARLLDETVDDEVRLTIDARAERAINELVAVSVDSSMYEGNGRQRALCDLVHTRRVMAPSTAIQIPVRLRNQRDGTDHVAGMLSALLIGEESTPVQPAELRLQIDARLVDDETFSDEVEDFVDEERLVLRDFSVTDVIERDYRAGGELRVELRALAQLLPSGRIAIFGTVNLFEGRTEGNTDLDGSEVFHFSVDPATFTREVIRVANTDEGGDYATITMSRAGR